MLKNFLKTAARNFGKQRMTSLINVSGLAIGMTAAILIFLWIRNELSFDNYHKDSQNIYRIKSYIGLGKKDASIWENSPYYFGEKATIFAGDLGWEVYPSTGGAKIAHGDVRFNPGDPNVMGTYTKMMIDLF